MQKLQTLLSGIDLHLILVNDGSSRGVQPSDIQHLQKHLPSFTYLSYEVNQGKGFALRTGVAHSTSPLCLYTDIDFPYEETSMARVYQTLAHGNVDIAIGIRDADYYAQVPPSRTKISKLLKRLTRNFLRLPINDTQCGLKGFNQKGRQLFLETQINRYLFDLEFIYLASKLAQEVVMVPIEVALKPEIVFSKMNFKILLQESYSFLKIFFTSSSQRFKSK
ncbi:glycosyltransferase involved in cell wall biosynthesis [Rufibacter quisquiliarum]|uniref:Glycosyltransferase involved in cell wall biosynthesis n=2 Tax=Rufibacter quisquiliarum TaxID=1549639 RepID=A0A839GLN6_9BACT|nr:glycosyltransferase involved in cell wall biosynthesis [Rufibacter quisquiliarum]